jgi:chromosome segregation ATPase
MMDLGRQIHEHWDNIERASKALAGLRKDYGALQTMLAPFAATGDSVVKRVKEFNAAGDQLAREIGSLEQTPQGPLAGQVQKLADKKKSLDGRISLLDAEFLKRAALRHDTTVLFDRFDRALDVLGERPKTDGAVDIDTHLEELTTFVEGTQAHLDEIEHRAIAFSQLKTKLGELQSRPAHAGGPEWPCGQTRRWAAANA